MPRVSAVLITFNEEADIGRALDSVSWCDEILVVDSGSTDRTVAICRQRGCKVLHRKFTGYGDQKAFAVSQAAHDWVLSIDADEEISPALRQEILAALGRPGECRGYYLPVTTVLWDQVVRMQPRHTACKLRLFDRRFGVFGPYLVHESVILQGPAGRLHQPMFNYSYRSIADYFGKFNSYTSAAAEQAFLRRKHSHFLCALALFPITFLRFYFLRGFLWDGSIGATWSLFCALYPAVKQFKLAELRRAEKTASREPHREARGASAAMQAPPRSGMLRPASGYVLALGAVGAALLLNSLFTEMRAINYFLLLLAAVLASARLWGFGPALAATLAALLSLDYFVLPPVNQFSMPDASGVLQLSLFAGLSLLSSAFIYSGRRRHSS